MAQVEVGNHTMGHSSWMNFIPNYHTRKEESFLWQTQDQIQMDLNCRILKSYFYSFITFKSCTHLDGRHTVFGSVKNGLAVLDEIEVIKTGANDVPKVRKENLTNFRNW
jgi:hypothetical protein